MMLESLSRYHAIGLIERELGSASGEDATRLGAISEHVRAALYLESHPAGQKQTVPVLTSTITRIVKQRLSPLWPDLVYGELASELVLQEVRHLAKLGEVMKVAPSHWIPAPARTIKVDDDTRILIDSSPLSILPFRLRKASQVVGRARLIDTRRIDSTALPPLQGATEWLRCPHAHVRVWSKAFVERAATKLLPVEDFEDVDIFVDGRWRHLQALNDKRMDIQLYRRKISIYGNHTSEYGLCRLRMKSDGHLRVVSSLAIDKNDARRLCGSMTLAEGRAQIVKFHRIADLAVLHLPRLLPAPESTFLSLGWTSAEQASADWPKRMVFSGRLVPLLSNAIELLGYTLVEQISGGATDAK